MQSSEIVQSGSNRLQIKCTVITIYVNNADMYTRYTHTAHGLGDIRVIDCFWAKRKGA
jgi:hypothetical protein